MVFIIFHILVLHGFGSLNAILGNLSSYIISFYLVIFKDISLGLFYMIMVFILLFFDPDILGNPDNLVIADPLVTPEHIIPELYFLFIYA